MEKVRFLCGDCQRFVDTWDLEVETWDRLCKLGRMVNPLSMNCRKGSRKLPLHYRSTKPKLKRRVLVEF